MKDRVTYYDALRGLAIIGVVAIHSTGIGYTFDDSSIDFNVTTFWRQMINFSVPIFITISGFFLLNKKVDTKKRYYGFIKQQIPRVLVPYLIWSALYLGVYFYQGVPISELLFRLFTFSPSVPFYFVALVIEYYILLPFIQKLVNLRGLIFSGLISFSCCLIIFYLRYHTHLPLPLFIVGSAPSWLIFFVLGGYLRKNTINIKNIYLIIFIIIGYALSIVETYFLYHTFDDIGGAVTAIKVSSFTYSIFLILFAFKNNDKGYFKSKFFTYTGEVSFGIFLSHMFFMIGTKSIINNLFPILKENATLYQLSLICTTFICCMIFATLMRKLDKAIAIRYLGQ